MLRTIAFLLMFVAPALAQDAAQFVARQFGPAFTVASNAAVLAADLDGDGSEDSVIVATAKDPLPDQAEFHYKVLDPYDAYFGFGDPNITAQFSVQEGAAPRVLLVAHDWRAAAPKAKFVIVNLPFERVSIARRLLKKKVVTVIRAEEASGLSSSLYWTGKQYKWQPAAE